MSKSTGSVAPKERVNIKYVPATSNEQAEVELPHKMLVLGDFGLDDSRALGQRPRLPQATAAPAQQRAGP